MRGRCRAIAITWRRAILGIGDDRVGKRAELFSCCRCWLFIKAKDTRPPSPFGGPVRGKRCHVYAADADADMSRHPRSSSQPLPSLFFELASFFLFAGRGRPSNSGIPCPFGVISRPNSPLRSLLPCLLPQPRPPAPALSNSRSQIRVTPVAGRRDGPPPSTVRGNVAAAAASVSAAARRRGPPTAAGEREHGAKIRDMVMKAAHVGYVDEDDAGAGGGAAGAGAAWRTPLASVDSLSRQLKDTWENFNANFAVAGEPRSGNGGHGSHMLPEY